jgi:single-stranded DNA-binding protein
MNTMLTVNAIGRVTKDFEVQQSRANEPYVRFNLAVNKGYGDNAHPVFLQCWLFGIAAERLVKAKVGKGSLLHITGDLDITKYKKDDGVELTIPKVIVFDWGYVPVSRPKTDENSPPANDANGTNEPAASLGDFAEIDCNDDEELPF